MSDYNCPQCGATLLEAADAAEVGMCIQCDWDGNLDDAAINTNSPFDVRAEQPTLDDRNGQVVVHLSKTKTCRLSPQKAENFAEALETAARDARGHRTPTDDHLKGGER